MPANAKITALKTTNLQSLVVTLNGLSLGVCISLNKSLILIENMHFILLTHPELLFIIFYYH